ncbi:MAG: hypothetical protein EPO32_14090 [Anaerolineae bacterium]|nr:MAG: hypothetical protein EPO32_14090 [Anaerolineae bacterium]
MSESMRFLRNVLGKATLLFVAVNLLFATTDPLSFLGNLSLYNGPIPGRQRIPFGEEPDKAYNLSLNSLEAMFASHELTAGAKPVDEFRVILIGDSSVWGFLLENQDTLSAQLNSADLTTPAGHSVRFYNLGYPTISLTKDLLIIDEAMRYQPDLIIWLVTLESMPHNKQTFTPLVQHNPGRVRALIAEYGLSIDPANPDFKDLTFLQKTLWGQRRPLADLLRLQLYGFAWGATGIDQYIPAAYTERANDLPLVTEYYDLEPDFTADAIAFDVLDAGIARAGDVPLLLVNEPMFIADGANSDIRYNFFYPKWAYNRYLVLMAEQAAVNGWLYADVWQAVSNDEYTNSAIHLTPAGEVQLAAKLLELIHPLLNP